MNIYCNNKYTMNRTKSNKIVPVVTANTIEGVKLEAKDKKQVNTKAKVNDIDKKYSETKWLTGC